jgi:predicted patatin/cPLA2 family phospholipase
MNHKTLIFSGGGLRCLSFLGSLKYLIKHNHIQENFKDIKHIITVSGGLLFIIPLLLGFSINFTIELFLRLNYNLLLDYQHFSVHNIFTDYGIFSNNFMKQCCHELYKHKHLPTNFNLQDLYNMTNIKVSSKVVNLNTNKVIFINYKSHPTLSLITLLQMTTCIPIVFKPVIYKDEYYVDGGLCGNFPLEYNQSDNYIGFNIIHNKNNKINNLFDYLETLKKSIGKTLLHKHKQIIHLNINHNPLDMNLSYDNKKNIIRDGYRQTRSHYKHYKL